jgi:dTDP-glucose 4,6-dehydratase
MKLLVCGGAGFIGSNFVRLRVRDEGDEVVVLDKLTYAGRRENLANLDVRLVIGDIADQAAVDEAIGDGVDAIVNFAAETHVDRSIAEPDAFITTNGEGTYQLLEAVRRHDVARFVHISTDEVFGSIEEGYFTE